METRPIIMQRDLRNVARHLAVILLCALPCACSSTATFPPAADGTGRRHAPTERDFRPSDMAMVTCWGGRSAGPGTRGWERMLALVLDGLRAEAARTPMPT